MKEARGEKNMIEKHTKESQLILEQLEDRGTDPKELNI